MTWTTRPRSELAGLAAITAGKGPLLLLVHGVGLRAEAWGAQIDALAGDFEVVAADMPGHGGSPALRDGAGLEEYTDRIAGLLDRPAVVAGHSMGAMIALDLASRYPDRVLGAAALNAVFERSAKAHQAVQARAAELDGRSMADPAATLARWFGGADTPERAACEDWLRQADPAGYRAAYRVFAHENGPSRAALAGLACPALFLTGSAEPNSTPDMSRTMAGLAPKARAEVIDGAAHMMPMTHAEDVTARLRRFAEECQR